MTTTIPARYPLTLTSRLNDALLFFANLLPYLPALWRRRRAKDCFKAHDHAIQIAKAIAVALRKASSGTSSKQRRLARDQEDHPTSPSLQDAREGSQQRSPGIDANNIPGDIGENTSPLAASEIARKPGEAGSSLGKSASDSDEPSPVLFMVARLCASAPDRAEGRAKLAGGIAALLPELGAYDRGRFISFLAKVCSIGAACFSRRCS